MKKTVLSLLTLCVLAAAIGCSGDTTSTHVSVDTATPTYQSEDDVDVVTTGGTVITFTTESILTTISDPTTTRGGDTTTVDVTTTTQLAGSTLTITEGGVYTIQGTGLGNIVIEAGSGELVTLVLDGCDITSLDGPVIDAEQSDKLILNLKEGSVNVLTDSAASSSELKSAIFSNDDITINGTGTLTINACYGNGIHTDDDLVITNGLITITAVNNALKANDSITIKDATLFLSAGNDAIHAENNDDAEQGVIAIESGTFTISAYGDGIDASASVTVYGGTLDIRSGVNNQNISLVSGKGIKATSSVGIVDGSFTITSKDDAIHSNNSVAILGGTFSIFSYDDGIHADEQLEIDGGTIDITRSYEGIESLALVINGGTLTIKATDDGINGAGGVDSSGTFPWQPGGGGVTGSATLAINGGYVYVDAAGDGIDINGSITMTAGTVIVNGPTESMNGALDYDSSFKLTGGLLVAAGSMGMAQNIGSTSTQCGVLVNLTTASAKIVRIETSSGQEIITFKPSKNVQTVVISTPDLAKGTTYNVYVGGTVTGYASIIGGIYSGGTYASGTLYKTFTISAITTTVGTSTGMR